MSELRYNRITGDWVIIAKERARRPEEFAGMFINPSIPEDSANYLRNPVVESAVYGAK